MKTDMKKIVHMLLVLTIVGFISGASLSIVYKYAAPLIAETQEDALREAIFKIFLKADSYEKICTKCGSSSCRKKDTEKIFLVKDKAGKNLGYAFIAEGNGYQGIIRLMAGIKLDLVTLVGIEILESQETPGLGQEITTDNFKKQFIDLKTIPVISYVKEQEPEKPNEIQAITGATISSKAIVAILNEKIEKIRKIGLSSKQ